MSCTNIKGKFCLLNFYSGCLGVLPPVLSGGGGGVFHNIIRNCLQGTIILASAIIFESIIDVTSQYTTRPCQKWYKTFETKCVCVPLCNDKNLWKALWLLTKNSSKKTL